MDNKNMKVQFTALPPQPKLYEIVANKIESEILQNPEQVGRRLPSELELSTSFGVSRTVVREAFKILEERKLVNVRNGEGAYVEKPENDDLADVLRRIILMENIDLNNALELRMILEPPACAMAARNCAGHPEKLESLREIHAQTISEQHDQIQRAQYDLDFHLEIARLSGNPILTCFVNAIQQMILQLMKNAISTQEGDDLGIRYHQYIISVLEIGDPEKAAAAMTAHLSGCQKFFLKNA